MEKQIDEMAKALADTWVVDLEGNPHDLSEVLMMCDIETISEQLYEQGYRKVEQGYWFIREYEFFTCSECGHDYWNGCDCTKEAKEQLAEGEYPNYCPNCGAKMKGE